MTPKKILQAVVARLKDTQQNYKHKVKVTPGFSVRSDGVEIRVDVRHSRLEYLIQSAACYIERVTVALVLVDPRPLKNDAYALLDTLEDLQKSIIGWDPSEFQFVSKLLGTGPVNLAASPSTGQACEAELVATFQVDIDKQR